MDTAEETKSVEPYINIARRADIFSPKEIKIIKDLLIDCRSSVDGDYVIIDEKQGSQLVGFAVIGRIEWTRFSWDLYWVIVDKKHQRQGIGQKLLKRVEEFLLKTAQHTVVVAEISSNREYAPAAAFFSNAGFSKAGILPDYFSKGDSLITYYKEVKKSQLQL
ncbi:MAG: GNAT family N-acetyltransferase [bacterium]